MKKITVIFLLVIIAVSFFAFRGSGVVEQGDEATGRVDSVLVSPGGEAKAANMILQSTDGGQTWQDVSHGLPMNEMPEDFFAGDSDIYLRVRDEMYHSRSDLKTPVWEKEILLDPQCNSIAFNRSGVVAYGYGGQIYRRMPTVQGWSPMYTNAPKRSLRNVFEASDGAVFLGCETGLFKSIDGGRTWKQVVPEGVGELVESDGVIIGIGQKGIMRSTDNGEHWEWVISEGGVGIAVERIEGGFAAIAYNSTLHSRRIYLSTDNGKTWNPIDQGLRPALSISSIKQIGRYLVVGHPDGIFRSSDMGKTWNMVHLSPEVAFGIDRKPSKVFRLYVSGNVMYAVARGAGC